MIKIRVSDSLHEQTDTNGEVSIDVRSKKEYIDYNHRGKVAYAPFINAHDHLIYNWFPKAGSRGHYTNSIVWMEENIHSDSYLERSKIWVKDDNFDLTLGEARTLALLGMYKNIFSGVHVVQDHIKRQKPEYYDYFDICVLKDYSQCQSISSGDFDDEMRLSAGARPFIIHLAEGIDCTAKNEFNLLVENDLLKANTLIVHGIALDSDDFIQIYKTKASVCWCPSANMYLVGETLDVIAALETGINITLGTDSTMTGSINIFDEFKYAKRVCKDITARQLYEMVTKKAEIALMLFDAEIVAKKKSLLILDKLHDDVYENLMYQDVDAIDLLIHDSKPIYGNIEYFEDFELNTDKYEIIKVGNKEKFVIGKPTELMNKVNETLGYKKNLPYLPF